ncbi:MAG: serpin family protein [Pirellulales bacterium]
MIDKSSQFVRSRREFHAALAAAMMIPMIRSLSAASPVPAPANYDELVSANNAFALKLLEEIEKAKPGQNEFFSPFSIHAALLMALEGARSNTAQEIGTVLQLAAGKKTSEKGSPWDLTAIRREYAAAAKLFQKTNTPAAEKMRKEIADLRKQLAAANSSADSLGRSNKYREAQKAQMEAERLANRINQLAPQVDQFELDCANSMWVEKTFPLSSVYANNIRQHYGSSEAVAVDFKNDFEKQRARINQWVSDHTAGKITDILTPGTIDSLTRFVLANAIYFKGTWSRPFEVSQTKPQTFFGAGGNEVQIPMMNAWGFEAGKYAAFKADGSNFETPTMVPIDFKDEEGYPDKDGFVAAELPYNGDVLSMLVLLPRSKDGLKKLSASITAEKLAKVSASLQNRTMHLQLPRFKLDSNYDLRAILTSLGMPDRLQPSG